MKKNRILFCWSMLLSVLLIGLASKSSPIYPMNDWVDVNCFFTMGRGMLDGMVPYRDLYEQKGPVLYFVYAIISLFSRDSYWGVYLLEAVTFGLFLYFSGKLARLYLGESKVTYPLVAVLGAALVTSWSFTHGGSVEQLSLFMLVYSMYSVLRAMKENRALSFREAFINGILAATILWVKYTILGFYAGLALFVVIWYLTDSQLRNKLLLTIGQFLLGAAAVTAVVFAYFICHGALQDLLTVYFYNNIFLYAEEVSGSRLEQMWDCLHGALRANTNYGWMIWSGILWLFLKQKNHWKAAIMSLMCFVFLALTTYWGCKGWDYYGFIFAAFCIFGLIAIAQLLRSTVLYDLWHKYVPQHILAPILAAVLLLSYLLGATVQYNQNIYLTKYSKADTVQYRFAETIQTVENPTLLNYGFLDGGFYFASGAKPACRYFCYFNIEPPQMWEEQNACIQNGEADFIVTRYYQLEQYGLDCSKYRLVDEAAHPFDQTYTYTYYLYQRIS